jgi:formylglycine-generating enzyme required for sulfatase activity/serine/threonine protein kinase
MSEHPAPAEPSLPAALPEQFGQYRILEKLGEGGMGAVYRAHDAKLDRPVALKVPHLLPGKGREVLQRFLREARLAAKLRHPNICPIHEVGQIDGIDYLAMAFIPGKSLAELISPDRPMAPAKVAALVRTLALALHEAHKAGVIHRDLKPSNIMIDERQEPVIMDFGLAYSLQGDDPLRTQSGAVLGTPAYMAPEQASADRQALGPRCDVYSLGVILYQLLTGRLPFTGPLMAVLGQVLTQPPPPPSAVRTAVDPGLEQICLRAMAKKPENRFASMQEFADALTHWRRSGSRSLLPPVPAAPAPDLATPETRTPQPALLTPLAQERRPPGRKKTSRPLPRLLGWVLAAVVVAVALVLGIVALVGGDRKPPSKGAIAQNSAPLPPKPTQPARRDPSPELVKARAEAEAAGERIKDLDRGQGFAARLDALDVARKAALELKDEAEAIKAWQKCAQDASALREQDDKRRQARAVRDRANQARQQAEKTDAAARAPADWKEAERKADQAQQAFEAGDMVGAQRSWAAARLAYDKARQAAAVVVPVEKEIENSIGMQLVRIPEGNFWMGAAAGEKGASSDEKPRRKVEILRDFYLGKFEVTQAQYQKVMGKNPSWFSADGGGKDKVWRMGTKDFPVENISWHDAKEFCKKLSELQEEKAKGRKYDLPTEAEWEYACRAGTQTPFHFGSQLNGKEANCDGTNPYGTTANGPYLQRTCKVGSYPANAFGLCDMHGNVWEWCRDRYGKDYYRSGHNIDPEGPENGAYWVLRGGSWDDSAMHCRAAYRDRTDPALPNRRVGFRVRLRLD